MKVIVATALIVSPCLSAISQGIGIGTSTPSPSAILDLTSTTKGFLPPRMTSAQRTALGSVAGMIVYDNTEGRMYYRSPSGWGYLTDNSFWSLNGAGTGIYNTTHNLGVGTSTPHTTAALHVQSSTKGFLPPVMTSTNRNLILGPAEGLMVYDNTFDHLYQYQDGAWKRLLNSDYWGINGNNIYNTTANVGIGLSGPTERLHVSGNIRTSGNVMTAGDIIMNNTGGILQFQSAAVNTGYVQISGNNLRLGTNSGNSAGEVVFRLNASDLFVMQNNNGSALMRLNSGGTHMATIQVNSSGNLLLNTQGSNDLVTINNEVYVNATANRVGIGTSGPDEKLDVRGNTQILGDIILSGRVLKYTNTSVQLTPLCFGRVNALGQVLTGGSGNFTAEIITEGQFRVHNADITGTSTIVVTLNTSNAQVIVSGGCNNGYCNVYMKDAFGDFTPINQAFMFVIYK